MTDSSRKSKVNARPSMIFANRDFCCVGFVRFYGSYFGATPGASADENVFSRSLLVFGL